MRVALLHDWLGRSKGGIEAWIYHAAEVLLAQGHSVVAFADLIDKVPSDAVPPGVEAHKVQSTPRFWLPGLGFGRRLEAIVRQIEPLCREVDVFWARSYMMTLAAHRVAAGRPVVFIQATPCAFYDKLCERNEPVKRPLVRRLQKHWEHLMIQRYERRAMTHADALVYLSRSRRDETLDYYGDGFRAKSHVVPPGVNLRRFHPENTLWDGRPPMRIVSVCRLSAEKNIARVIQAVEVLKHRGIEVQATVVGEGPRRTVLEALVKQLDLTDWVHFAGRQDRIGDYYREAHLFVLPSTYEGFGSAYLEALASGLPCVAIRSRPGKYLVATDEIITHEETGLLIEEDDTTELADAIEKAYRNPDKVQQWSKNARALCEEKYTWSHAVENILALTPNVHGRGSAVSEKGHVGGGM